MRVHRLAVCGYGDGAVAVGAKHARSFGQNSLDRVRAGMTKGVRLAHRYSRDRGVNRIEKRRSAGSLSAVVRNFQEVRGELVAVRQDAALHSAFDVSGQEKLILPIFEAQDHGIIVARACWIA